MENFRKLTDLELDKYGVTRSMSDSSSSLHKSYREFVKTYYPPSAELIEVVVDSEYNDNTYVNNVRMVVVFDKHGDEIVPNKKTAKECRSNMTSIGVGNRSYDTPEPVESFYVHMTPTIPDLYVKI